jgi:hypothetical protein
VAITDSLWRSDRRPPLLPDHGKLMHLVLARVSNGAADSVTVAHLHPIRVQADTFRSALPMLPAGRYLLFGDVLFQSGATRTLVDTVTVTTSAAGTATPDARATSPDTDDAWRTLTLTPAGQPAELAGGGTMTLSLDAPAVAKRDLRLSARVTDAGGAEALLDTYMGMAGHAFVLRADGSFFMHLHPMGTASMTAQAQLARRERGDTTSSLDSAVAAPMPGMTHDTMSDDATGAVHFPFAFPAPGRYVVFVQVKRRGVIETAGFQVVVP